MTESNLFGVFRQSFLYESNFRIDCRYNQWIYNNTEDRSIYSSRDNTSYCYYILHNILYTCEAYCKRYSEDSKKKVSYKWYIPIYFPVNDVHDRRIYWIVAVHGTLKYCFFYKYTTLLWDYDTPGIPDELFDRDDEVPITKEDIRSVIISKLRLKKNSSVIDIGCGSGSITVELCLQTRDGNVYGVDFNQRAVELTKRNLQKFGVKAKIFLSNAQDILPLLPQVNSVMIGGTWGDTERVIQLGIDRLKKGGRIVIDTILIETMYKTITMINEAKLNEVDITQVTISKARKVSTGTMMTSRNPVMIISATK